MSFEQENETENIIVKSNADNIDDIVERNTEKTESDEDSSVISEFVDSKVGMDEQGNVKPINIPAVALRSAFWTFVAGILLCACFLSFFPYSAMRFYSRFDLKDMALMSAEKYLSRNSDKYAEATRKTPAPFGKYADALYCAANNSIHFMNGKVQNKGYESRDARYYAEKVVKHSDEYIRFTIALSERTSRVQSYNLIHSAPALHPYVYSYTDYLATMRFKAYYILGDYAKMGTIINETTTPWINAGSDWQFANEYEFDEFMLLISELNAYLDGEFTKIGLDKLISEAKDGVLYPQGIGDEINLYGAQKPFDLFIEDSGRFALLYTDTVKHIDKFVDYIRDNSIRYAPDSSAPDLMKHLQYTYYLKNLSVFVRNMINMTATLSANNKFFDEVYREELKKSYDTWQSSYFVSDVRYTRDGITTTSSCYLGEWYNWGMLNDYLLFYRAA